MHVVFLPKWYPGRKDPQLGDFLRKQALAAAAHVRMSIVHIEGIHDLAPGDDESTATLGNAWELTVRYRMSRSRWRVWRKAVNFLRYWSTARRAWRRIVRDRGRPDIIHAYILVRPALFAWWTSRRTGIPYLVSEQSSEYLDGTFSKKGPLFRWLSRSLFRRAALVTAVSPWLGDQLVRLGLCDAYEVVPNVVPGLDRPLPARGVPGRFMVVADLVDRTKNISGVLRALAAARRTDARLELCIIGDGPDRGHLQRTVEDLQLSQAVQFLGRMTNEEVLGHMGSTFGAIVNSNVETFSVVTGEALAQGKPVIVTRCGGPVAFVKPENGILIEPKDDSALARAMLELTDQAQRYDPTVIRGSVSERFGPDAVGRAFLAVYRRVVP